MGQPSKKVRALYSTINPTSVIPSGFIDGFLNYWIPVKKKENSDNPDKMDYTVGSDIGDKVADAAWRKYLGLEYDEQYLPKGEYDEKTGTSDVYKLPLEVEREIPTDTTMLKGRIETNRNFIKNKHSWEIPNHVSVALDADEKALEALRKTYKTGQPVGISEFSYNSRKWGTGSEPEGDTPPLNVLQNYNIRYDKKTNRMYYSDTYDFNEYEKWLEGTPFRIRGWIDLNK